MSVRIKRSRLKEFLDPNTPIEMRENKLDKEIKDTKLAILNAQMESSMMARSLRKNLAKLLTVKSMLNKKT